VDARLWVGHFLDAVCAEAAVGLALLRLIERS
jgi:protein Tex